MSKVMWSEKIKQNAAADLAEKGSCYLRQGDPQQRGTRLLTSAAQLLSFKASDYEGVYVHALVHYAKLSYTEAEESVAAVLRDEYPKNSLPYRLEKVVEVAEAWPLTPGTEALKEVQEWTGCRWSVSDMSK